MPDLTRRAAAPFMLAALAASALVPTAATAQDANTLRVDARSVTAVETAQSRFALGPMRRWTEAGRGGGTFTFIERARDDTSVWLSDDSRGVRLQIDIDRALVLYADDSAPAMRPLYPITRSSDAVTGRNVVFARVAGGHYIMTSPRVWIEQGNDGAQFTFRETRRDDDSVYLTDASRGVRLQIDTRGSQVLYADRPAPRMQPLYPVSFMSAIAQ